MARKGGQLNLEGPVEAPDEQKWPDHVAYGDIEADLPELTEGEFPPFAASPDQRRRWRLVVGLTRLIAGHDDFQFAQQLYFGDMATDSTTDGKVSEALLIRPVSTCALNSDDAPHLASPSLDPGQFTEPIGEFAMSFDPGAFPPRLLSRLARSVHETYLRTGDLPDTGLDSWRACLYWAWKSRATWFQDEAGMGDPRKSWERSLPKESAFIRAVVNAIHKEIWQEEQWWWAMPGDPAPVAGDRWERAVSRSEEAFAPQTMYRQATRWLDDAIAAEDNTHDGRAGRSRNSSDPLDCYRDRLAARIAQGLLRGVAEDHPGVEHLAALHMARAEAWYGSLGLTYEEYGAPPILDLVGASEAAEILGVELTRVARWSKSDRLPPPYLNLRMSPVWVRSDIQRLHDLGKLDGHTQPPDPPVLVGTAEAAEMLGVDKSQIARWRKHPSKRGPRFPEPVASIKAGPLWKRSDVTVFGFARDSWRDR